MADYLVEQIRREPEHRVVRRETYGTTTVRTEVARYRDAGVARAVADGLNAFAADEVVSPWC